MTSYRQINTPQWLLWKKVFWGKACGKANFSKSALKRSHRRAIYSVRHHGMDPFFTLILCRDVELNPGPINQQKNSKPAKQDLNQDFFEILVRLERKIDSGQENILENQTQMLTWISIIEEESEKFKVDIPDLKTKQSELESKVIAMSEDIGFNHDHGRDLQFLMDRHEQYSRKKSVRIRGERISNRYFWRL